MLDLHVQIVSITRHLESSPEQREQLLTEILLWPELLTFGNRLKTVRRQQQELAELLLKREDPSYVHERQVPGEPNAGEVTIELHPPHPSSTWREPVRLRFDLVEWQHDTTTVIYVPELGIEVIASDPKEIPTMLEEHIRTAILRSGSAQNLFALALCQRTRETEIETSKLNLYPETPKERWDKALSEDKKQSELHKVGIDLRQVNLPQAFRYDDHVKRLAQMLSGRRPMSVLIVGPPGVGKTAIVHELVRSRTRHGLERAEFWKTSGARIVAGQSGFGDWQERCQKIAEEARERNAILYFGNLTELLETGRASGSSENIAGFFRPRMMRGEVLAILECTPEQLTAIEKRDPRILDGLRQLKVEEPSQKIAFDILWDVARQRLMRYGSQPPEEAALQRLDALHRRYHGYSAYPGKPIRFLDRLLFKPTGVAKLSVERVNEVFSSETGLPLDLLEDSIPLNLDETRKWFHERLKGQDRAVDLVVDTIAMIKARLSRPGQPLGSFLFVGPTGVGKTELAKCLAEYFYASSERMIRLDMSEYHAFGSATRLVSGQQDGHEGILTAQMRDQPFSVVLLDEFEKAHPQVFDLFLQVLGEARLTDGAGRVADFSNAIIIMTSNLGAQSFRAGSKLGFEGQEQEDLGAEEHFTSEAKKVFRPEFFNRIDRIVPFLPLNRSTLEGILEKELKAIHHRDGLRERQIKLALGGSTVEEVLQHGHDPRYGARPLRREIDHRVLLRVSQHLNENPSHQRGTIDLSSSELTFGKDSGKQPNTAIELDRLSHAARMRRFFQQLRQAAFVSELNSERYRLERRIENHRRSKEGDPEEIRVTYERRTFIGNLLDRLEQRSNTAVAYEEQLLLRLLGKSKSDLPKLDQVQDHEYQELLIDLYAGAENAPPRIVLMIQAESLSRVLSLSKDYCQVAETFGCQVSAAFYHKKPPLELIHADEKHVLPELIPDLDQFFAKPAKGIAAMALQFSQAHAYLLFNGESGGHEFELEDKSGKRKERVSIKLLEEELSQAWMDLEEVLKPELKYSPIHRYYNLIRSTWKDSNLGFNGNDPYCTGLLQQLLHERLVHLAEQAL